MPRSAVATILALILAASPVGAAQWSVPGGASGATGGAVADTLVGPPPPAGAGVQDDLMPVRVDVRGVRGALSQNVRAHLTLVREQDLGRVLTESQVRALHARAPAEIRAALEPFGHYGPEIDGELIRERQRWTATYRIEPGPAVRLAAVELTATGPGAEDDAIRSALAAFPLRPGDVLRHDVYEQGKRAVQAAALERGYLDAAFVERRVEVDVDAGTARADLRLETGIRYRLGPVTFQGAELEAELLQGFVPFERGAYVSMASLRELERVLWQTDLFAGVEVQLARARRDGDEIPVDVHLTPRPRRLYDLGAGYGTDTGPRTTLGAEWRRLNRYGHHADAELRFSRIRNGATARYSIPLAGAAGNRIAFSAAVLDERGRGARTTSAVLGTGVHWSRGSWRESLLLNLHHERYDAGDERRYRTLVLPGASWTRTRSDDPLYPTRGYRIRFDLTGTHPWLGSGVSFGQAAVRTRGVYSPWPAGRVLARAEVGGTRIGDAADLPVSLRFFAGGDRSVRGYAYRGLGPEGEDGSILGGRHYVVGGLEYEHRIRDAWGAAVFMDAGNAGNEWPVSPRAAAGVGGRWRSPIGMVRVDVAAALAEPGTPLRLHLTVGADL